MDKILQFYDLLLGIIITVGTAAIALTGITSVIKALSKEDWNGAMNNFIMSGLGLAMLYCYPLMVKFIQSYFGR